VQPQTQTHDVTFSETEVRKRYLRWDRGEPDREWGCLTLLAAHAPGVAPRPLRREADEGAPVVVMERLVGSPLGGAPLTPAQIASLGGPFASSTTCRSPPSLAPASPSG